jgi:membrane peptidoglycan carboxypeptidase
MGIFGIGEASRFYFGKRPQQLTLGESAILTGMIKSPNTFSL